MPSLLARLADGGGHAPEPGPALQGQLLRQLASGQDFAQRRRQWQERDAGGLPATVRLRDAPSREWTAAAAVPAVTEPGNADPSACRSSGSRPGWSTR